MARPKKIPTTNHEEFITEDLPILTSFGIAKIGPLWQAYQITSQGDRVLDAKMLAEGQTRAVALETFKISSIKHMLEDVK